MCTSAEQAEEVKRRLSAWLAPRGLAFNEDKTRIVHLDDGFDFLGFNVRRYQDKLLIKPSRAAVRRLRERLAVEVKALRGSQPHSATLPTGLGACRFARRLTSFTLRPSNRAVSSTETLFAISATARSTAT